MNRGAGTHNIGTSDIRFHGRIGECPRIIACVDILHQSASDHIFAHRVEHVDPQSREFDRIHPFGRSKPAGQRPPEQDMAPARNHGLRGSGKHRPDQTRRLLFERGRRKTALARTQNAYTLHRATGRGRNIKLGLEAEEFVELVGRHVLKFLQRWQIRQVQIRGRWRCFHWQGLDDLSRLGCRRLRGTALGRCRCTARLRCRGRTWARRGIIETRRQQIDRRFLCPDHCRRQRERCAAYQPCRFHRAASGTSIVCSMGCNGSSPPSINAAISNATNSTANTPPTFLPLIAKFFASRSKC